MPEVDSLTISVSASSDTAATNLGNLAAKLREVREAAGGGAGLGSTSKRLQEIVAATTGAQSAGDKIQKLAGALSTLQSVQKASGLNSVTNTLKKLNGLDMPGVSAEKMQTIAAALGELNTVQKADGLNSTLNSLKKVPDIIKNLDGADLEKFRTQTEGVADAVRPLAAEMEKVAKGFSAFPQRIQSVIRSNQGLVASNREVTNSNQSLANSNQSTAKSYNSLGDILRSVSAKTSIYLVTFRRLSSMFSKWVTESNAYVENMNLFTVTMGDAADEAYRYAETVQKAVGIDPSDWIRNQGMFKQITSGFGVAEENANLMSKNLTQLGYDISSFYNISIEESMQKLQSAISGELEPVRRLGYAIDVATLQQVAYNHGITESVNNMNQAQKSQLRYLAIMEQSGNVMGDMARTVQTPANAMRILGQQVTQLARAAGNVLIPVLQKIIPVAQAIVELLTEALQKLAELLGFELPTIDYSGLGGVTSGAEDAEDAIDDASAAVKEFKRQLIGIDELTVLQMPDNGGGGAGTGLLGTDLGLNLPQYDFLEGLQEQVSEIKDKIKELILPLLGVGAALLALKIDPDVLGWFKDVKNGTLKKSVGLLLMISGFTLEWESAYNLGYEGFTLENILSTLITSALGIAGSLLFFGTGPLGWTIGITTALVIGITAYVEGVNQRKLEEAINEMFGSIELTHEMAVELAAKITTSDLTIELDLYADEVKLAETLKKNVENSINELNKLNLRAQLGLDVDPETYKQAVDTYVKNAEDYIQQQRIVAVTAVDILLGGTETGKSLTEFTNEFYDQTYDILHEKGEQLKEIVAEGFVDGEWIPDKLQEAIKLQNEINDVLNYQSELETRAKLQSIALDFKSTDFTYESYQELHDQIQEATNKHIDQLDSVRIEALKMAEITYDQQIANGATKAAAESLYNETVAAIDKEFRGKKTDIVVEGLTWELSGLTDNFESNIASIQPVLEKDFRGFLNDTFAIDGDKIKIGTDISYYDFFQTLQGHYIEAFESMELDEYTQKALKEVLETMKPRAEELRELADEAKAAGEVVPEKISEALHDYNMLAALSGDVSAITYLIGEGLSTDPEFLNMLTKALNAGAAVPEEILEGLEDNNYKLLKAPSGSFMIVRQGIEEETPQLAKTAYTAGGVMSSSLYDGASELMISDLPKWKSWAVTPYSAFEDEMFVTAPVDAGKAIADGLYEGASDEMLNNLPKWNQLALEPHSEIKRALLINSPSRKFAEIGNYISDGLLEGINERKPSLMRGLTNWAKEITDKVMVAFDINSPSRVFRDKIGRNLGLGIAEGLEDTGDDVASSAAEIIKRAQEAFDGNDGAIRLDPRERGLFVGVEYNRAPDEEFADAEVDFTGENERMNEQVINALYAICERIVRAINDKDTNTYMDGELVTQRITSLQEQYGRVYRR